MMNIKKFEVAMFGFSISSGEMFHEIMTGGDRMKELFKDKKPYVHLEHYSGDTIFLYRTVDERNSNYQKAVELGFRAVPLINIIYVDAKYLRDDE